MKETEMNDYEYKFLTGKWEGVKGAAYNQVFEFCRNFGWCAGFDAHGNAILTKHGIKALKDYQEKM